MDWQTRMVRRSRSTFSHVTAKTSPLRMPDGKVKMNTYRRNLGIRARPAHKGRMHKLSYEWLAGFREIVIDPVRCPLIFEEFAMKGYERDRDGNWLDIIPDGDDHSIDAVRYALMDDVLRG